MANLVRGLLVLLLLASYVGAYNYGIYVQGLRADAKASAQKTTNAEASTKEVVAERQTEQAAQAVVNGETLNAGLAQGDLLLALAVANGTADRLQRELAATRDNLSGKGSYTSLAERSASATKAAMVLSDLYGSCQRRLTEIAGAFDQSHSRGTSCSTTYDAVSKVFADGS